MDETLIEVTVSKAGGVQEGSEGAEDVWTTSLTINLQQWNI